MSYVSHLPASAAAAAASSPSRIPGPQRSRSGTISSRPTGSSWATGVGAAVGALETTREEQDEDVSSGGGAAAGGSGWSRAGEGRSSGSTSRADSPVLDARGIEDRRQAYQSLALRQLEREGRPMSMGMNGGTGRKRMKKWLVLVVPPDILPHSPPPLPTSGFANGYGAPGRFSGGILLPLQQTLSTQVALIAREFALPSVAGVGLYLCLSPTSQASQPLPAPPDHNGYLAPHPASSPSGWKPRLTEDVFQILFADYFDPDAQVDGMPGVNGLPIAARLEFDIDQRRARWLPGWLALPPATLESFQAIAPRSPAFETAAGGRPRFGTSLSYNRPFTPTSQSEAHVSELYTTDEEGEVPPTDEEETAKNYPLHHLTSSPEEHPHTSTPRSHFAAPRPLSLLSHGSSVRHATSESSPRSEFLSRAATPASPAGLPDEPERSPPRRLSTARAMAASQPMTLEDSGFGELEPPTDVAKDLSSEDESLTPGAGGLPSAREPVALPPLAQEASIEVNEDGTTFAFPRPTPRTFRSARPPTPSNPLDSFSIAVPDTAEGLEASTDDWTAQLDKLREVSRGVLVEGVEHPSEYGSFDETVSFEGIIGELGGVDGLGAGREELGTAGSSVPLQPPSFPLPPVPSLPTLTSNASVAAPPPVAPILVTDPPAPSLSPVLSPSSTPGYPYNLACLYLPAREPYYRLHRLVPSVIRIPPRLLFDLTPTLPSIYPVFQLYPSVYPHLSPYPSYPADFQPSSGASTSARRSPRPPPLPLEPDEPSGFHAMLDSWPPTPPSPERLPSPSLMDRLQYSGEDTGGEGVERQFSDEKVSTAEEDQPMGYERESSLIERDLEVKMRSLAEASELSPALRPVEDPYEGAELEDSSKELDPNSPTLVEDDPFSPANTRWEDQAAEQADEEDGTSDSDDDEEFDFAAYGLNRPLSTVIEENETDQTAVSVAGPVRDGGFFGDLAGSDIEEVDEAEAMRYVRRSLEDDDDNSPRIPSMSFPAPFDPPKIIYSAATASPSPSSSRYSSSPPRSPDFHGGSPLPSPTITPARAYRPHELEIRPESPTPCFPRPLPLPGEDSPPSHHGTAETDDYTFNASDDTRTAALDPTSTTAVSTTGEVDEPYVLSPGLQRALGLDSDPDFEPVRFGPGDELSSDESPSEAGSDGSQYAVGQADDSCVTYDHLSPLPFPLPVSHSTTPTAPTPKPVLFSFSSTEESRDFVDAIAQFVCEAQMQSVERRGRFVVALSGYEPLPQLLSQALIEDERIEFDKWEVFFTESTVTPHNDPSSTLAAYSSFLSQVPIPADRVHLVKEDLLDPNRREVCPHVADEVAEDMESQLARTFGGRETLDGPPRFDLVLLGIGEDGSCASLLPGHPLLSESHFLLSPVPPPPSSPSFPTTSSSPPTTRLTFTLPLLCAARRLAFLAVGRCKATALANVLDLDLPMEEKVPAGRIRLGTGQPVIVFADKDAVEGVDYPRTRFWDAEDEEQEEERQETETF
ncbi:hypothetical protein JCM8547_008204 [Rhodosporidiobolus lusitaniae]